MGKFWIDDGNGEDWTQWPEVEATSAEKAAEVYTSEHAEDDWWSNDVTVRVRDEKGLVKAIALTWYVKLVVNVRSVKVER